MNLKKSEILTKTPVVIGLAMICCLLWGSAFPCVKLGYEWCMVGENAASKILFAGVRFTIAGVLAIAFCSLICGELLVPKSLNTSKHTAVLSLFQTILQYIFFYIGLSNTTGVKASVIEGTNVFVAIIVTCLIFRMESITVRKIVGCMIGFAGVVLINSGSGLGGGFMLTGEGFVFISTVAYAFSSIMSKRFSRIDNPLLLSGWQFLFGGIVMTVFGALMGGHFSLPDMRSVLMLIYLGFVSAAAYSIWSVLLKYNNVSKIAVFGFMNPVFGVILSALLLDEADSAFSVKGIVSLVLVCVGIFTVNFSKRKEAAEENVQ